MSKGRRFHLSQRITYPYTYVKEVIPSMSFAPHLIWHYEHKRPFGVLCHPSDGEA